MKILNAILLFSLALIIGSTAGIARAQGKISRPDIRDLLDKSRKEVDSKSKREHLYRLSEAAPSTPAEIRLLREATRTEDKHFREAALNALRRIPKPSEFTPELKAAYADLVDDSDDAIQIVGFDACSAAGHKKCAKKIHARISSRKKFRIRGKNFGGVSADDIRYMQRAVDALAELGHTEALDDVVARDEIIHLDGVAGPLIAKFGAAALPKVLPLARTSDERSAAARSVIANLRDERAADSLIGLLNDSDAKLAAAAATALARMPTDDTSLRARIESGLEGLREHPDPYCRAHAYAGLVRLNPARHMAETMKAIRDGSVLPVRILYSLIQHDVKEAAPHLKVFIEQDSERNPNKRYIRRLAAQAVYKLTGEKVPYKGFEQDLDRFKNGLAPNPYDPEERTP